jgi:hypothetical protein
VTAEAEGLTTRRRFATSTVAAGAGVSGMKDGAER